MSQSTMPTRLSRFFAFTFFLFLALSASAVVPSVEKLLPDDTLFLVTTPDFVKMRDVYRASPQTQFWEDASMRPFREKFLDKLHSDLLDPLEHDLGVKFADYTNLLQGQITLAMTQNEWPAKDGQKPAVLFLLDTKDKSGQLTKNIADMRKKWVDAGKTIRTEKIRNTDFYALSISDKDMPKTLRKFSGSGSESDSDSDSGTTNAPKSELFIGQYESLLIIGTAAAPIEKVLVHLTGGAMPSLGDLAAYEENRLALFRDAPFYGWVNVKSLFDVLTHKPAKDDSDTADPFAMLKPEKILAAIGIGGLKTLAFSVQTSTEGSTVQFTASVPESSRKGLLTLFPATGKDSSPPAFVPADVVKFQRSRIDGQKAWATIQKVIGDIYPQGAAGIHFMLDTANAAAKEKDPNFDLEKNFFGNLGDDIISYQKAPRNNSIAGLNSAPGLFLISSPNSDQLASAFKFVLVLANAQGAEPKDREFLGRKIYTAELGNPMEGMSPAKASAPRTLSYASSGGYVAFSSDPSMVEEYLRSSDSQKKALRETPGLTDAFAKVGGSNTGILGYENQAETTRSVFEALRTTAATNSASASMLPGFAALPGANSFKDWMDFSLLPPFDRISKYFGITVYAASSDANGFTLKMYAPVPAALRK